MITECIISKCRHVEPIELIKRPAGLGLGAELKWKDTAAMKRLKTGREAKRFFQRTSQLDKNSRVEGSFSKTYPQIDDRLGLIKACKEAMVININ